MSDELITTPFDAKSTAMEVVEGTDLTGKQAIVTGATSGIGRETARALASVGATVTLAVRDADAGQRVADDIRATTRNKEVFVARLDLADWLTIDDFVTTWHRPLHILIDNAGVMAIPTLELSKQGFEMQFAVNHLGHFKLALGLHDALVAAGNARVVSVSSRANLNAPVSFDDIHFEKREYDPMIAYGQSKTANVLFAVDGDKRWAEDGIHVNALHPGAIIDTNLTRYQSAEYIEEARKRYTFKSVQQGAATSVLMAVSPQLEGVGGRYFEDCNEAGTVHPEPGVFLPGGVADYAVDPGNARRLWDASLSMMD
jgi:NAD(P)-dependent dehydrogenase (short-subunit alcohol dehydrogenase family)